MTQPRARRQSWAESPPADWGERQAKRIADEVKRLRGKNSAQWLADRTKELGYEVSRSVISDLENGRRRYVTTAELVILSMVLDAPPVVLVYPGPYQNKVEMLPGHEIEEFKAAQWFSGLTAPPVAEELNAYRRLAEHISLRSHLLADITRNPDAPTVSLLWEQVAMYDKMIHDLKEQLGISDDDA